MMGGTAMQRLVGLLTVATLLAAVGEARRLQSPQHATQVTPSEPAIDDGGWRPVIDSRISYEPQTAASSQSDDHTLDLVPPPVGAPKSNVRGAKPPSRKPAGPKGAHSHSHSHAHPHSHSHSHSDLSGSETRVPVSADGPTGPSRPTMRFPDQSSKRNPGQQSRRRPSPAHHHHHHHPEHHHHHHHSPSEHHHHPPSDLHHHASEHKHHTSEHKPHFNVRQNTYVTSESTQQLRFRPSPQAPTAFENPYPSWLVPNEESHNIPQQQQQQQQPFFNPDTSSILQLQQQFSSPNAQYHLSVPQQQELANSQFQQQTQQTQPSQQQQSLTAQNAFIPGTTTIFGNAGLFNLNPDLQNERQNLFLSPTVTEPSVHENEVPEGPQVFVTHTTRGRPNRPGFDIPKFPFTDPTVPTFQQQENSDLRPRRPRPPTGIQAQLEGARRPNIDDNVRLTAAVPTEVTNEETPRPRHPRPPSTEPPSWSHPVLESNRLRKPRPPVQNTEEVSNTRGRRPRPPVAEQEQQEIRGRRPVKPTVDEQQWKPSTPLPEPPQHLRPQEDTDEVRPSRRPARPPAPVQEQVDDDVERPVFTLKPRRPVPSREPEVQEEEPVRVRRPRPPVVQEEQQAQEDVDGSVNVRPQRPEEEERPRVRRPRPPQDAVKRRRPRPPVVQEAEEEEAPRHRPVARPVEDSEVEEDRPQRRRPVTPRVRPTEEEQSYAVVEPQEPFIQEIVEIFTEPPTVESIPETTNSPSTTQAPLPTFPPKRRRPIKTEEYEEELPEEGNYPSQFTRVTTEAATTVPPTTTLPPTTTRSLINNRLRQRLNSTRPRFSVSGSFKDRLNRLTAAKKNEGSTTTTAAPPPADDSQRTRPRTRESSRFRLTTEQPETERTSFKPNLNRRPGSKFYSRYRTTTEEPATTPASQDATRRTSEDIYAIRDRKPFLKTREKEVNENDLPVTSMSFSVSEVTTTIPSDDLSTTTPAPGDVEDSTEINTTAYPEEAAPTTPAEDFSLARRVTDLTSSATAFKPLSFFSAVPADGKSRSQLTSRFTMATEDPILPLEAFFPTFPSKPASKEVVDEVEEDSE